MMKDKRWGNPSNEAEQQNPQNKDGHGWHKLLKHREVYFILIKVRKHKENITHKSLCVKQHGK